MNRNKYNHVGRPTNEEVRKFSRKNKLKVIAIMSMLIVVVGGIFLYLNKDNLELAGLMGNSTSKTMLTIQNNKDYRTLNFKADAHDGKYLYQKYAESGNKKLVTYIYQKLGFGDTKKYKAKAIKFYYNGKLLDKSKAVATGDYIKLDKSAYGKSLSAIVYAQNLNTKKLEKKAIRITVAKTGPFVGKKYKLKDYQLKGIAYLAYKTQGTIRGAIFEAALMANRFELYSSWYDGEYEDSIYDYIKYSGWWPNSENYMNYIADLPSNVLDGVKNVLVNGYRPMPQYIDERKCITCGDVYKIVYNGKTIIDYDDIINTKKYVNGKTTIYYKYHGIYTFYMFPTTNGVAFGYSDGAATLYKTNKLLNK